MARPVFCSDFSALERHHISGLENTQFGYSIDLQDGLAVIGGINGRGSAYLYDVAAGRELLEFLPSVQTGAGFGWGLGIDGDRVIAGQYSDNVLDRLSGSAFIFDATTGKQLHHLKADDSEEFDSFGSAADILGNYAIVGAPSIGAAYLFDVSTGTFARKLVADNPAQFAGFGTAVALDGDLAIVGAAGTQSGSAYVFDVTTGNQLLKLTADDAMPNQLFGKSVSIQNDLAVIGAPSLEAGRELGAAYVFDLTTGQQLFKLVADEPAKKVGVDVDIFGDVAIVGASFDSEFGTIAGAAYLFDLTNGEQIGKITASGLTGREEFGQAVQLNADYAVIGSAASDSVYVFIVPEPAFSSATLAAFVLAYVTRLRR